MKEFDIFQKQIFYESNFSEALRKIADEGLSRLLLLGGSSLTGLFLQADLIDEIQLTFVPKILGGKYLWVPSEHEALPAALSKNDSKFVLKRFHNRSWGFFESS